MGVEQDDRPAAACLRDLVGQSVGVRNDGFQPPFKPAAASDRVPEGVPMRRKGERLLKILSPRPGLKIPLVPRIDQTPAVLRTGVPWVARADKIVPVHR